MTLYLIGLGLANPEDITVRGLKTLKSCDVVYLENYTSILQKNVQELENLYGKKVILADREQIEQKADELLDKAKKGDVALLVVGDPMCATTHVDLLLRAKEKGVQTQILHNASIVSAIGAVGLEVYKYGKITSIPFHHANVSTPVDVYKMNASMGLHTLFLLDLDPKSGKFLGIQEAAEYLISKGVDSKTLAIGCARIGADDQKIHVSELGKLHEFSFGNAPFCVVIPGKMHFMEEQALSMWK
ncbi:MAG: diphthine synthase [Nanoarchaeota archaeon]|nr:diphthine synthase [Nanoarchaeota archaeon]